MPNKIRPLSAIKVKDIATYVRNKDIKFNAIYTHNDKGEQVAVHDNKQYNLAEFHKLFPIKLLPIAPKGTNCNKKLDFIYY